MVSTRRVGTRTARYLYALRMRPMHFVLHFCALLKPHWHFVRATQSNKRQPSTLTRRLGRGVCQRQVLHCQAVVSPAAPLAAQAVITPTSIESTATPPATSSVTRQQDNSSISTTPGNRRRRRRAQNTTVVTAGGNKALTPRELRKHTGLSIALCESILAARLKYKGIPRDPEKLQDRMQQLVRLLGPETAAAALRSTPNILSSRPEVLALHLQEWLAFFSETSTSSSGKPHVPAAIQQRLLGQPNLLTPGVEKLVGNLYEMGIMLQAQDLHAFAGKALKLALMQPSTLQQKLRALLAFLNSQQQQQQQHGANQPRLSVSLVAGPFSYQQIQQASLKDHRWLMLSSDTLLQRLAHMQEALQVSREDIGQLFLRMPSVVLKRQAVIAARITALKQLTGLQPDRAQAAILAFPALLNIREEVLQHRWNQLRRAAAVCNAWQHQLDQAAPSSIAALLAYSQARYDRLQRLISLNKHEGTSLQKIMRLSEQKYAETLQVDKQQTSRGRGRPPCRK